MGQDKFGMPGDALDFLAWLLGWQNVLACSTSDGSHLRVFQVPVCGLLVGPGGR